MTKMKIRCSGVEAKFDLERLVGASRTLEFLAQLFFNYDRCRPTLDDAELIVDWRKMGWAQGTGVFIMAIQKAQDGALARPV